MALQIATSWPMAPQFEYSPRPVDIRAAAEEDCLYILTQSPLQAISAVSKWTTAGHLLQSWQTTPLAVSQAIGGGKVYVLREIAVPEPGEHDLDIIRVWNTDGSGGQPLGIPFGYTDGTLSGSQDADLDIGPDGNLYVFSGCCNPFTAPETKTFRVQVFTPQGQFLRAWGTPGGGNGQFANGVDLTYSGTTLFDTYAGIGIRVGADGLVYCTDKFAHRIQVFGTDGSFQRAWGTHGTGCGQLNYPQKVVYQNNQVWVADLGGGTDDNPTGITERVQVFTPQGQFLHSYAVTFGYLTGGGYRKLTFTPDGLLWIPAFDDSGTVTAYREFSAVQLAAPVDRLFGFQHMLCAAQGMLTHLLAPLTGNVGNPTPVMAGSMPDMLVRADGALDAVCTGATGATARCVSRDMGLSWEVC